MGVCNSLSREDRDDSDEEVYDAADKKHIEVTVLGPPSESETITVQRTEEVGSIKRTIVANSEERLPPDKFITLVVRDSPNGSLRVIPDHFKASDLLPKRASHTAVTAYCLPNLRFNAAQMLSVIGPAEGSAGPVRGKAMIEWWVQFVAVGDTAVLLGQLATDSMDTVQHWLAAGLVEALVAVCRLNSHDSINGIPAELRASLSDAECASELLQSIILYVEEPIITDQFGDITPVNCDSAAAAEAKTKIGQALARALEACEVWELVPGSPEQGPPCLEVYGVAMAVLSWVASTEGEEYATACGQSYAPLMAVAAARLVSSETTRLEKHCLLELVHHAVGCRLDVLDEALAEAEVVTACLDRESEPLHRALMAGERGLLKLLGEGEANAGRRLMGCRIGAAIQMELQNPQGSPVVKQACEGDHQEAWQAFVATVLSPYQEAQAVAEQVKCEVNSPVASPAGGGFSIRDSMGPGSTTPR